MKGIVVVRTIVLAVATAASASAVAESPRYQRLDPVPPDADLSAAPLVNACIEIRANQQKLEETFKSMSQPCSSWPPVRDFCNRPLLNESPSADEATRIKNGECPVPAKKALLGEDLEPKSLLGGAGIASTQDAILRALAAFMVERAEQEAVLSVADGMQTVLCKDDKAKVLFPTLCDLLGTEDVYDNPPSWTALRTAAGRDFYELPLAILKQHPTGDVDRDEAIFTATDVAEQSLFGQLPLPLFAAIAMRFEKDAQPPSPGKIVSPFRTTLYVAGIAAQIAWPAISQVQTDPDRLLAGAVSARRLYQFLRDKGIVTDAKSLQVVVQAIEDIYRRSTSQKEASASDGEEQPSGFQLSIALARSLTVAYPIVAPNGGGKDALEIVSHLVDAVQALQSRDYTAALVDITTCLKKIDQNNPIPPTVMRYMQMLAELAVAKDPDQAKQVILSAAAPAGSWRGKREPGKVTFAINGYVGLQGGYEWLGSGDLPRAPSWTYGLYAPIGFEGTVGLGKRAGSLGLFFSVLDLGALLNFRTEASDAKSSNSTSTVQTDPAPAYTFKEVFSPGLFLRYGLGPVPLAFGVGAALTPELRRVTVVDNNTRRDVPAFHIGAFLALDLTILPF
jgi:hypothetical protein